MSQVSAGLAQGGVTGWKATVDPPDAEEESISATIGACAKANPPLSSATRTNCREYPNIALSRETSKPNNSNRTPRTNGRLRWYLGTLALMDIKPDTPHVFAARGLVSVR